MSYFLIGEAPADDAPLFVLWTRDASGVRVLPIGSRDRRDMQALGRRLIEVTTEDGDPTQTLELVLASEPRQLDGRPLHLVDLDHVEQREIERRLASDLALEDDHGPTAPAA